MRGGNILAVEARSNDAIIFDPKLRELERIRGTPLPPEATKVTKQMAKISQSDFTTEADVVLWINGPYQLSLLNVLTDKVIDLSGFWFDQVSGSDCYAMAALASHRLLKAAGIGQNGNALSLHLWDATTSSVKKASKNLAELLQSTISLCSEAAEMPWMLRRREYYLYRRWRRQCFRQTVPSSSNLRFDSQSSH